MMLTSKILKEMSKDCAMYDDVEVDALFVTVLGKDGSVRCIPYGDDIGLNVGLLASGLLKEAELIGLASELAYLKSCDKEKYEVLYNMIQDQTDFDDYEKLDSMIEDMIELDEEIEEQGTMVC